MKEVVAVLGPMGSGKSTQCARLAKEGYNGVPVKHLSVGNLLRNIRQGVVLSTFSDYLKNPDNLSPLPEAIMEQILLEALQEPTPEPLEEETTGLILVEGYPRYIRAVDGFTANLCAESEGRRFHGTVYFDGISRAESVRRVTSRPPRAEEAPRSRDEIEHKYDRDHSITSMTLLALGRKGPFEAITASASENEVQAEFRIALGKIALADHEPAWG